MNRKHYPSDISRKQFEQIRPLLEGAKKKTWPRRQDLYDIFCAIWYLLKNATTWRVAWRLSVAQYRALLL